MALQSSTSYINIWMSTSQVVDMVTGDVLKTLPGDTEPVTAIAVHPSGTRAVVASRSYITKLWDIELGRCLRTWQV